MATWKSLKTETIEAGGNNFVEISLREPPEGDVKFLAFSKGWKTDDGEKRYKSNVLIPEEKAKELLEAIEKVLK